jgi:hypothetical protein
VRRSSTLLTRLALALLAVLGFVAPLATPEADRVVQTVGGKPSAVETQQQASTPRRAAVVRGQPAPLEPVLHAQSAAPVSRRYLLHRAWLL